MAFLFLLIGAFASCNDSNRPVKQNPAHPISRGAPDGATLFASKVEALARFVASDRPSFQKALDLLAGTIEGPENNRHVEVKCQGYRAVVTKAEQKGGPVVAELSLYPDSEIGLRFNDLTAVLGDWDRGKAIRSKTSHVQFPYGSRSGNGAMVYVALAFPPTDPASPVLSVKIRRETSSRQGE